MQKRLRGLLGAFLALVLGLLALSAPAQGTIPILPDDVITQYEAVFENHGISESEWPGLLDKLQRGETLDADKGTVEPVESYASVVGETDQVRSVYPDGSVSISSVGDVPTSEHGGVQPMGTSTKECTTSSSGGWTYYKNCKIVYDGVSFSYSFRSDYQTKSGSPAKINRAYSPVVHRAIAHDTSDVKATIVRANQSGTLPAQSRMSFQATALYVLWSKTVTLDLKILGTIRGTSTNL